MFRIRRIYDYTLPVERTLLDQVRAMLRAQFPGIADREIDDIQDHLRNPMAYKYRTILFVAENARGDLRGFAILLHLSDLDACYLDFMSAAPGRSGGGIGGALYERVREEARNLGADGLFCECLPDDPALCKDPKTLQQNASRMRFYERFGARPISGTAYETPVEPDDDCPPYLVFDDLGSGTPLSATRARLLVKAFLTRKYGRICSPEYVRMVLESFRDDPVRLRPPRYSRRQPLPVRTVPSVERQIALVVNEHHDIHHVKERGYVEAPVRIVSILREIEPTGLFTRIEPVHHAEQHIRAVHDNGFVDYLKRVCPNVPPGQSIYPYVFPIRNASRPPRDLPIRAGYYCIDTFTPLNGNAWLAAKRAVDCALTACDALLHRHRLAYALVRPPGHHAEHRAFGGFCYLNSAAIAAHFLSRHGPVAVLDIDYHHGNGTQNIFYSRKDVLSVSLHGHPRFAYPYFSGFADETGEGEGKGFNLNLPLTETLDGPGYRKALAEALRRIRRFKPRFLVVSLGLDSARGDPTGSWSLAGADFEANGRMVGALGLPTLVVQEGGYRIRTLGANANNFFSGLWDGAFGPKQGAVLS
jgi:acetoin utilization deacetylase AcuC-like enzyme/GNAT superfamily N-acetyltransferase